MKIFDERASELVALLRAKPLNGGCEFVLTNACPDDWGVVINDGGAKFFYSDGTDYTDGPKPLGLRSGDSYSFYSDDGSKCVKQIFLAMTVSVPGEASQTMTYISEMSKDGECWLKNGVQLGPKNSAEAAEFDSGVIWKLAITPVGSR